MKNSSYRSSHQRCSIIKGVLKNFAKIHRKTPVPESQFNKVADLSLFYRTPPVMTASLVKNITTKVLATIGNVPFYSVVTFENIS